MARFALNQRQQHHTQFAVFKQAVQFTAVAAHRMTPGAMMVEVAFMHFTMTIAEAIRTESMKHNAYLSGFFRYIESSPIYLI
ncbi:conserved protein of unknown function [Serratia sp. Tan611]|nr:conserved protein of unknown function [Serratia sp. Tan611]